jgi:surface antigen
MGKYANVKVSRKKIKMFRSNKNNTDQKDATSSLSTLQYLRVEPQGSRFTRYRAAAVKKPLVSTFMVLVGVLFVAASAIVPHMVRADSYDEQINALQAENQQHQNAVSDLASQATSYQDAINQLQAQISTIQSVISANEAKQAELQGQINANQIELEKQRNVLGENIKMTYVDGQPSTIEMLASSKNLSDFVDKEEYRTAVQTKIQNTLKKIAELQNKLNAQKQEVETLLASQKAQQAQLDSARAKQASMLAYNQAQQAAYNQKTQANASKIADLRRQQAIENARLTSGDGSYIVAGNNGNDTYPNKWRNAAQDSMVDNWGMYNRECVSYTAWKVYSSGRNMPYWGGYGNANQWDDNARAAGIPVDTSPRAGDVAIKNSGTYGHAMYVEKVFSDGSIYISQYNQDYQGHYSEAYISAASVRANNLQFIHF